MGKSLFNGAITCVVAFLTLVAVSSCVDEKFELAKDKLDLNVTVFQEGISIPLGSTEKIVLESLYEQLDSATRARLSCSEIFFRWLPGWKFRRSSPKASQRCISCRNEARDFCKPSSSGCPRLMR